MKNIIAMTKLREAFADPIEPENERIIAKVYWRALIVLSIFLAACALVYSFEKFQTALEVFNVDASQAKKNEPFARPDLDEAVAVFDSRAQNYAALKAAPLSDPDPSQ